MQVLHMANKRPCTLNDFATIAYAHCHNHGPVRAWDGEDNPIHYHAMTKAHGYRILHANSMDEAIVILWRALNGLDGPEVVSPDLDIMAGWLEDWGLLLMR